MTRAVIKRRVIGEEDSFNTVSDADRYDILRRYRLGETLVSIANLKNLSLATIKIFVSTEISGLSTIQEINKLTNEAKGLITTVRNPTALMNDKFLENVDDGKEVYAFYYAMTGSNEHALEQAGLDKWIPTGVGAKTKRYTLSVRGKFIRDLPGIQEYINEIRDKRLRDMDLGRPYIQSELVEQIEQLKEISGDDPKYRSNLLKAIELLGRTMEAFSDTIRIEDADPRTGLEILMAKAKAEVSGGVTTYEPSEE